MKRSYDERLNALVEALALLSSDAQDQINYLEGICAADELADTVDQLFVMYKREFLVSKISEIFGIKVEELSKLIDDIQSCDSEIWSDEALHSNEKWRAIRAVSRAMLLELDRVYVNLPLLQMKAQLGLKR